jgi:hypothetical protein
VVGLGGDEGRSSSDVGEGGAGGPSGELIDDRRDSRNAARGLQIKTVVG